MISQSLEDYIEIIYNKISSGENIKAIDIANKLHISRPSVSEALIRLADKDLIVYEGRKGIKITKKGEIEAKKVIKKHKILSEFFGDILGINEVLSNENACKIEHVIDEAVIEKIKAFSAFCKTRNIAEQFRKEKVNDK